MLSRLQILEEECLQLQNSTSSDDSMVAGSLAPSKDKNTNTNIPNPQASPVRPQSQGEGQGQGYLQGSIDHQVVDMPGSIYPYKSPDTEALQNPQWDQPNADATDPFTFKGNEVDATDTFTFKSNGLKDMTMPSKLTALHEDLALQSVVSTSPTIDSGIEDPSKMIGYGGFCGNDSTIELQLPRPQELNSLLQIYFIEHNLFFPCVDRRSFEAKLLKMLIDKGYGRGNQTVRLSVTERSFGALLCVMLALAVFINPQEPLYKNEMPLSAHTACHSWHRMGLVLSEPSQLAKIQGIDIVRYHLLEAMYLINIERLAEASRAVVIAIDMAIRMGLNRQKTWEASHADQTLERRMLWWTLYYMDRKLAEKCSRPCFIRDTEVDVDDFAAALATGGAKQREMLQSATGRTWDVAYLQTLVDWARLWGKIWDTFFAARAQGLGNSDEVEAMDARIEGVRRRLPAEVRWDTSLFQLLDHSAENELQIRAQLLVLVVSPVALRMLLLLSNMATAIQPATTEPAAQPPDQTVARPVCHFLLRLSGARDSQHARHVSGPVPQHRPAGVLCDRGAGRMRLPADPLDRHGRVAAGPGGGDPRGQRLATHHPPGLATARGGHARRDGPESGVFHHQRVVQERRAAARAGSAV